MDYRLPLLFSVFAYSPGFCSPPLYALREFHFIDLQMNWSNAQQYCREKYTDLATIESMDDNRRLIALKNKDAWIGLQDDPVSWTGNGRNERNSWRWSSTGELSDSVNHNWQTDQPDNGHGQQNCVVMNPDATWDDQICDKTCYFVCYNAANPPGQRTFVLIEQNMNWTDAQKYCRQHHTDLAVILTELEARDLETVKGPNRVWIGLYREPWRWSDNRNSSFRIWDVGQPNNYALAQFCAMLHSFDTWGDTECSNLFPFWCQTVPKKNIYKFKMKIKTSVDLSDPALNNQLLQQLGEVLSKTELADLKLQWSIQPRKQEEEEDEDKNEGPAN